MDAIEKITHKSHTISIYYDEYAQNPFDTFDHLGTLSTEPPDLDDIPIGIDTYERDEYYFTTLDRIKSEYSAISEDTINLARDVLQAEYDEYQAYKRGECYGYTVTDPEGNQVDSCWGFYDLDLTIGEAKSNTPDLKVRIYGVDTLTQAKTMVATLKHYNFSSFIEPTQNNYRVHVVNPCTEITDQLFIESDEVTE